MEEGKKFICQNGHQNELISIPFKDTDIDFDDKNLMMHIPFNSSFIIVIWCYNDNDDKRDDKVFYGAYSKKTGFDNNYPTKNIVLNTYNLGTQSCNLRSTAIRGKTVKFNISRFLGNAIKIIKGNPQNYQGVHFFSLNLIEDIFYNKYWNSTNDDISDNINKEFLPHPINYLGSKDKDDKWFIVDNISNLGNFNLPITYENRDKYQKLFSDKGNDIIFNDKKGNFFIRKGERKKLYDSLTKPFLSQSFIQVNNLVKLCCDPLYNDDILNKLVIEKEEKYENPMIDLCEEKTGLDMTNYRKYLFLIYDCVSSLRYQELEFSVNYNMNCLMFMHDLIEDSVNISDYLNNNFFNDMKHYYMNKYNYYLHSFNNGNPFNLTKEDPELYVNNDKQDENYDCFLKCFNEKNLKNKYLYKIFKVIEPLNSILSNYQIFDHKLNNSEEEFVRKTRTSDKQQLDLSSLLYNGGKKISLRSF